MQVRSVVLILARFGNERLSVSEKTKTAREMKVQVGIVNMILEILVPSQHELASNFGTIFVETWLYLMEMRSQHDHNTLSNRGARPKTRRSYR